MAGGCSGRISGGPGADGPGDARGGSGQTGRNPNGGSAGDGNGDAGGEPPPPDELDTRGVPECEERSLPGQPLRRLSSQQYHNTLSDLLGNELGTPLVESSIFPSTVISTGFSNDAEANAVNTQESNAIEDNAERIAARVLEDPVPFVRGLMPCAISESFGDAEIDDCIDAFIDDIGLRAYRRPLEDGERTIVAELYTTLRADQSATEAFAALIQFFVQSPALLYRVERGSGVTQGGLVRLSDYEMASRLSYFYLDSMPDTALFEAAEAGELSTPAQVATHARRLIESPRFAQVLDGFHRDWLRLYELEQGGKDAALFPQYTPEVRTAFAEEASQLVRYVLDEGDGSIATLLGSDRIPVNSALADLYGVDAPGADENTWVAVEVPDRKGLLTLGSLMAALADEDKTNPIHRGAFFQKEILCHSLPAFPANLDTQTPLEDTSGLPTARGRLSPLLENGACMGCHSQFNPTGLAFESFDAIGQWRDQENGADIDASGSVSLDGELLEFDSPLELVTGLAQSQEAQDCYALQWYRAALGRREFAEDACSLALTSNAVAASQGDLRELLIAITQTDGFLYRQPQEEEP